MKVIYEPRGRAREYAPLALNIYRGCSHGCIYCYAPSCTDRQREDFNNNIMPRLNVLRDVKKDAQKIKNDKREILLSFTSDPYQHIETKLKLTMQVIEILITNNLTFTILTKGGYRAMRDFDLFEKYPKARFGISLCFTSDRDRQIWEPNSASVQERIESIKEAHQRAIPTWVSIEPVIEPGQAIELIWEYHDIVDFWKVGKLNYHPLEKTIDWKRFREDVLKVLNEVGANYYIKKDLLEWDKNE